MPILEASNVIRLYKQYDVTITAVDRVNLSVEDGEFVAIMGSSGSGKSTLLHVCAGLDRANSGTISSATRSSMPAVRYIRLVVRASAVRGTSSVFRLAASSRISETARHSIMMPTALDTPTLVMPLE